MATSANLTAQRRDTVGKGAARVMRRDGQVPAVIYGHAREAMSIAVPARELQRLLERISAENTVVELAIDGKPSRTLIREIQRHPFKRTILHVDFQELVAGETVTVDIPLTIVGIPREVRTGGAIMDQTLRDLSIEVDPAQMPNHIDVDVSELTIGHSIHVRDLKLPAGVKVLVDPDATIVIVQQSRAGIEAVAADASGAEPEVITAKKPADDK